MGLLGAMASGAAGAGMGVIDSWMKFDQQMDLLTKQVDMREESAVRQDARNQANKIADEVRADARSKAKTDEIYALAQGSAAREQSANLDQAAEIYRNSGMSPEDVNAGLGGVDEARGLLATPTSRQMAEARARVTGDGYMDLARMDEKNVDDAYTKEKDAYARAKDDRDFKLRSQEAGRGAELRKVQLEQAQLALDALKREAKIPPAVKASAELLRDEIKVINKTIYDAEAMNTLTPEGQAALTKKAADLAERANRLYEPYLPKGDNGLPAGAVVRDFSAVGRGG